MSQQLELLTESPSQWTSVSLLTPEIQKKEIKPFVILALKELEGNPDSRTSSLMNTDKFSAVREVVRHFARLRSATKEPWGQEDVRTFLEGLRSKQTASQIFSSDDEAGHQQLMKKPQDYKASSSSLTSKHNKQTATGFKMFSPDCVLEFTTLLCTEKMYENVPIHLRVKPGLVSMQWKIDISLTQSSIASEHPSPERTKELMHRDTHIILILQLTDGKTHTYRLSYEKFHELRYTVASALKSLIVLEKRKCMRKE